MTQDTIKQRLRAARKLIDKPGKWIQGGGNGWTTRCVAEAIVNVCLISEEQKIRRHLLKSINLHWTEHGVYHLTLTGWNDTPGRTHAEVMQAFGQAIGEA